jgi:PTH1 family peptidyl-tRNA hydrolase
MLVVGLGNPGPRYASTRHNVGFRVVECLGRRHACEWFEEPALQAQVAAMVIADRPIVLLEPQTFMNRSGDSVAAALERWPELDPESDLIVVYDDLDLPTGRIRLRPRGGGGGHNGIGHILDRLGTRAIPRLRFGIGHPGAGAAVIDWVLGPFAPDEETDLLPAATERAAAALEAVIREGVVSAMEHYNRATDEPG